MREVLKQSSARGRNKPCAGRTISRERVSGSQVIDRNLTTGRSSSRTQIVWIAIALKS